MHADIAVETGIHMDDIRTTLKSLDVVTSPVTRYVSLAFLRFKHGSTIDQELAERCGIGAGQTHCFHSPHGSTFLHEMTSLPPSLLCGVKSNMQLCQLMHIYLKNIPAVSYPNPI